MQIIYKRFKFKISSLIQHRIENSLAYDVSSLKRKKSELNKKKKNNNSWKFKYILMGIIWLWTFYYVTRLPDGNPADNQSHNNV